MTALSERSFDQLGLDFLLYRQRGQSNVKLEDCRGNQLWFYDLSLQCSVLAEACWAKVKDGGGPWLPMTRALM